MKATNHVSDDLQQNKILLIAYAFPPIPYSGAYRILRLCKGLASDGFEVHVLTINIDDDIPNDYNLLSEVPPSVFIHRSSILDPWLKYQGWKKRHLNNWWIKYINKVASLLLRLITIPDHQIFWIPFAVIKGFLIIKNNKIKTIFVSSPPHSTQLIGYLLQKFTNVKWIADFRDPIVGNVGLNKLFNSSSLFSILEKKILVNIENVTTNTAKAIISNTETHKNSIEKKYHIDKIYTIRNSFDEDDYKKFNNDKYDKFTISHIGTMYGFRKADILLNAIKKLEQETFPNELNIQIIFVGMNDISLENSVKNYQVEKYVAVQGLVKHDLAISIMMKSHLLLLIKATGPDSFGQIPAKFYEYIGTRNRIICIGAPESEVGNIINEYNFGWVAGENESQLYQILKDQYQNYVTGLHDEFLIRKDIADTFSKKIMARKVSAVVAKCNL